MATDSLLTGREACSTTGKQASYWKPGQLFNANEAMDLGGGGISEENLQPLLLKTSTLLNYILNICPCTHR